MPWCHHCKMEYIDGIQTCADCGAPLVDYPPDPPTKEPPVVYGGDPVEPVLLYTAADTLEADPLEALLRSEGIQVLRRYPGPGQYMNLYTGRARVEVCLYVHPDRLEEAQALLAAMSGEEDIPETEILDETGIRTRRRIRGWVLIIVFVLSTLLMSLDLVTGFLRTITEMLRQ